MSTLDTPRDRSASGRHVSRDVTASRVSPHAGRRFDSFDLPPEVRAGIQRAGFTHCTPIQEKVLPLTLGGRDVAGQAQTGTGKTAAFLITIFTRLLARQRPGRPAAPRALVIAPTRELVVQIAADARLLGEATPFTIPAVYGGIDYRKQRADVQSGVDVLIGTPGRLIDYFKQRVYDLRSVEILVIDEADRMFDMGFIKDLRYILRQLPSYDRRQSMLFSATLTHDVMELAYVFMNDAVRVAVTPEQVTAEKVEHLVYHVGVHEKMPLLIGILRREKDSRVLVFVNMRRSAERIVRTLEANGCSAAAVRPATGTRRGEHDADAAADPRPQCRVGYLRRVEIGVAATTDSAGNVKTGCPRIRRCQRPGSLPHAGRTLPRSTRMSSSGSPRSAASLRRASMTAGCSSRPSIGLMSVPIGGAPVAPSASVGRCDISPTLVSKTSTTARHAPARDGMARDWSALL